MAGFSLHAATVSEAHQRSKLERLCRYITRPPIATKRLSVDRRGRVVYGLDGWLDGVGPRKCVITN
ncbi:transposase [Elongatibacter sediminis]|uniref:Transposase n=1 Tax=Elongatibacter sediminis TaxID=3119006 RepID=A0AAW9RPF7_9GAMM